MDDLQQLVASFVDAHQLKMDIQLQIMDLLSELGELSKELLVKSSYENKDIEKNEKIEYEVGDVFFSLIRVANYFGINLKNSLELVLDKYAKRIEKGGTPDSINQ